MSESIVEWKPRPRNRISIKLSGGRFFTVPETEVEPYGPGAALPDDEVERLARVDQYWRGRDKALRLLARRERSRHEIKKALDVLEMQAPVRDGVLADLTEAGLIDDERFTRNYVESRMELKRLGPHRLRHDLARLGVASSIVDRVLRDQVSSEGQEAMAWALVRRKLGNSVPDERDVRRIGDLLRRKGIDYEVINQVMYKLLQQSRSERSFDEFPS